MNAPQQNPGGPAPDPTYPPNQPQNTPPPPPSEPPFIPYQKPSPPPPPPYYGQPGWTPPYPGPVPPYPYFKPKTKLATASLILGAIALGLVLLGLFGDVAALGESGYHNSSDLMSLSFPISVCGLLALIFGLVSRSRFKQYPSNFPGRRNSLLGIIFGSISLGILVLIYFIAFALIFYLFFLFILTA